MKTMRYEIWVWLFVINIMTLITYGIDKHKAVHHKWRIPEDALIGMAAIGGGIGALIGMHIFHHKTKHLKFRILVPVFIGIWIAALALWQANV